MPNASFYVHLIEVLGRDNFSRFLTSAQQSYDEIQKAIQSRTKQEFVSDSQTDCSKLKKNKSFLLSSSQELRSACFKFTTISLRITYKLLFCS